MKCPKYGSENTNDQMVSESQLKTKHKSVAVYQNCRYNWNV